MKATIVAVAIVIVLCVVALLNDGAATADNPATEPITARQHDQAGQRETSLGRFQISAFTNAGGGTGFGYYVIDSTTGEIWMGYGSEKPGKVSESLMK